VVEEHHEGGAGARGGREDAAVLGGGVVVGVEVAVGDDDADGRALAAFIDAVAQHLEGERRPAADVVHEEAGDLDL